MTTPASAPWRCAHQRLHHLGEAVTVEGGEDVGEADAVGAAEDDVECHIDLGVLAVDLLGGDVDTADRDSLFDDGGAVEAVDELDGGDDEDVDGVDEALVVGGDEGDISEGGVEVVGDESGLVRIMVMGMLVVVVEVVEEVVAVVAVAVAVGGEAETVEAEGSEGGKGAEWWEAFSSLKQNVKSVDGLRRKS
ncbi:hypothetical protein ACLOJK_040564 [Asimina triloba]